MSDLVSWSDGMYGVYRKIYHCKDTKPSAIGNCKRRVLFKFFMLLLPGVCFPQEQIFHSFKTVNDFVFFHCFPEQCLYFFKFAGIWLYLDTSIVCIRRLWRPVMWYSSDAGFRILPEGGYTTYRSWIKWIQSPQNCNIYWLQIVKLYIM